MGRGGGLYAALRLLLALVEIETKPLSKV